MENQRGLTIVLWVVVLFGIFFLARGLTGKAVLGVTSSDQCDSDNLCSYGKICCNGFCNMPEICSPVSNPITEEPKMQISYLADIGLGLLILMAVLIAFYGANRRNENREVKKVRKGKRKKKK